jgi:phenylacetate-CoA ligase
MVKTHDTIEQEVCDSTRIEIYKLEQDRTGACTFRYIPEAGARTDGVAALTDRLTEALAPNPVRVEAVDYIAGERSGKFQPCVSQISAEGAR